MLNPPKISVVIPACDRPEALRRCLAHLASGAQILASEFYEVIVSDDSPTAAVRELVARDFPWVRLIEGPRRGPAANRNCGAKAASHEWIVFTDDDCLPQREWLAALHCEMRLDRADLLEGQTICRDRTNALLEETIENPRGGNFWTCNLAVRRSLFEALKGFDEDFLEPAQEDAEFAARARASGARCCFVSDALVHHPARPLTIRQLWRRALMVRWFSLYLLKTRSGWAGQSLPAALLSVCAERSANLLRENWQSLREWRANGIARTCFHVCWRTSISPILLPYLLWWEVRFRKALSSPQPASPGHPVAVAPISS